MKLGVHIGYWGLGLTSQDQLGIVQEAERLGYDSVWAAEGYGSDTATVLAWLPGQTTKIRLGAGIFQMPGRSAAMTAMTAATIDQLSDGRMIVGIGSSGPQVAEGWHGQRFAKQLQRTREYVAVVRMALARERVEFHGETLELPLPDGPGKALKLTISPVQEQIPIYLAAIGPKNTALAGEIADGWIPTLFSPEHVSELRPLLQEGADRSGKSLDDFDIAPTVSLCIPDAPEQGATPCAPSSPSTSAAWARASRTSTTSSCSDMGMRPRHRRSRTSTSKASARRPWPRSPTRSSTPSRSAGRPTSSASVSPSTATPASARSASPPPPSPPPSVSSSCSCSPSSPPEQRGAGNRRTARARSIPAARAARRLRRPRARLSHDRPRTRPYRPGTPRHAADLATLAATRPGRGHALRARTRV